jgi:hypothetical protein
VDWDEDGLPDLLVGDGDGRVNFFRRLPSGDLTEMEDIYAAGQPIEVVDASAPFAVDWNEDGLLDLLVGCAYQGTTWGTLRLYINVGSPGSPEFYDYELLKCGGFEIVEPIIKPKVADLNGDGRKDLVLGIGSARFLFFENCGSDEHPEFASCDTLQSQGRPIDLSYYGLPCLCDWNDDGLLDLLAGDYTGCLYLYPGDDTGVEEEAPPLPDSPIEVGTLSNPCSDAIDLLIWLGGPSTGVVEISLFSSAGRLIDCQTFCDLQLGENVLSVDAGLLPPGVYHLLARSGVSLASCPVLLLE